MFKAYFRLLEGLNLLASVLVVGLMLLITTDVVSRVFFNAPLVGIPEITKLVVVCIAWLQFAYTLREGRHLRSNLIFDRLPNRARRLVFSLNCLFGMALFMIIAKLAAESAINAHAYKTFEGEDPVRIPIWPVWATISVSSLLLAVEYFRQLFRPFMAVPDNNAAHADSE